MKTLSCISLGLSLVFCCLLLALVAEFFYLFWWKKRVITNAGCEDGYSNPSKEFFTLCWKKPSSLSNIRPLNLQEPQAQGDLDTDIWDNPCNAPPQNPRVESYHIAHFGSEYYNRFGEEDSIDNEMMRSQQLSGPPRYLFTIKEETNEDLESEDMKSRVEETPYLTPTASPYLTPPLAPLTPSQNNQKLLSLFELVSDAEFNKIRSSPPPTFKFLRDAEEKHFRRKTNEEDDRYAFKNDEYIDAKVTSSLMPPKDEEDSSVITIVVSQNREKENVVHQHVLQYPSSSSQVLPT
ncbi:hypothetical protein LIER_17194 [Lithospermum erythrorhizon]|uniref:Uncharacterized protein n=1 Tax=Lithospermum erythrorhizon TaxID=34254 RepID=A0AAV3QDI5_LITER